MLRLKLIPGLPGERKWKIVFRLCFSKVKSTVFLNTFSDSDRLLVKSNRFITDEKHFKSLQSTSLRQSIDCTKLQLKIILMKNKILIVLINIREYMRWINRLHFPNILKYSSVKMRLIFNNL